MEWFITEGKKAYEALPSMRDYWQSMALGGRGINDFNGIAIGKLFLFQEKF